MDIPAYIGSKIRQLRFEVLSTSTKIRKCDYNHIDNVKVFQITWEATKLFSFIQEHCKLSTFWIYTFLFAHSIILYSI
jgi:hypothetical protein